MYAKIIMENEKLKEQVAVLTVEKEELLDALVQGVFEIDDQEGAINEQFKIMEAMKARIDKIEHAVNGKPQKDTVRMANGGIKFNGIFIKTANQEIAEFMVKTIEKGLARELA